MTFAGIVLAAGSASRFGGDKLSAELAGEPLLHHAIRAARAAPVDRVIVVTGKDLDIGNWPDLPPVTRIGIDSDAMSTSLKAGINAAQGMAGAFVFLGDMPQVPHDMATMLAGRIGDGYAAVPVHDGVAGHPVLLSSRAFPDIADLTGDAGAGKLLRNREDVIRVDTPDPGICLDVDRPEDLEKLQNPRG